MIDRDVIEDLDEAMASMPSEFAYEAMRAAIAEITRLRASPWVSVEERPWPPIDPDENGSVSIPVLIAYEGANPSPLDNVCYGWSEAEKWFMRGGESVKSKVVAWMPIPPLDQEEVA